jgi:putative sterol carrier protein
VATKEELREAIDDYVSQARDNPRVRKLLRGWSCVLHVVPTDVDAPFTIVVNDGEAQGVSEGLEGVPDLVLESTSEDFADVFWGDSNPASQYMNAAIKVRGSSEDVMRLDAMAMLIYLRE